MSERVENLFSLCERCTIAARGRVEWYEFAFNDGTSAAWNITKAQALVNARIAAWRPGDPPLPGSIGVVDPDVGAEILANNEIVLAHVEHVDPSVPGLSVQIPWQGNIITILIDGNHRLARHVRTGTEFETYILLPEEEAACRLSPAELRVYQRAQRFATLPGVRAILEGA